MNDLTREKIEYDALMDQLPAPEREHVNIAGCAVTVTREEFSDYLEWMKMFDDLFWSCHPEPNITPHWPKYQRMSWAAKKVWALMHVAEAV